MWEGLAGVMVSSDVTWCGVSPYQFRLKLCVFLLGCFINDYVILYVVLHECCVDGLIRLESGSRRVGQIALRQIAGFVAVILVVGSFAPVCTRQN